MTFTAFVLAFAAFTIVWNAVVIWHIGLELTRWLKSKMSKTQLVVCLKWPAKPGNDLAPWYVILWRILWAPFVFGGLGIAWLGVLMTMGYGESKQFWADVLP